MYVNKLFGIKYVLNMADEGSSGNDPSVTSMVLMV